MKRINYLSILICLLGVLASACNNDRIEPLHGGGGDDDDDPIEIMPPPPPPGTISSTDTLNI